MSSAPQRDARAYHADCLGCGPLGTVFESCGASVDACEFVNGRGQGVGYSFDDWAPDGHTFLLTGRACDPPYAPGPWPGDLSRWDIESNRRDTLIAHAARAAWSPTGDRIAFVLADASPLDTGHAQLSHWQRPRRRYSVSTPNHQAALTRM